MPEVLLHGPDVDSALECVNCVTVTECVVLIDSITVLANVWFMDNFSWIEILEQVHQLKRL